jgi:putative endonuclease
MKWFVYCLSSLARNYIYVGLTNNLERRLRQHNEGKETTTRLYRPFEMIHVEKYETRMEARRREKYLKSGIGTQFLRSLRDPYSSSRAL